jgi:hypothetical protein
MSDAREATTSNPSLDVVLAKHVVGSPKSDHTDLSRRDFLTVACGGAAILGGGLGAVAMPGDAQAQRWDHGADVWKSRARYQNYPNGASHCGGCLHFRPPARCAIVEPSISPYGWCRFFSPIPVVIVPEPDYQPYDYPRSWGRPPRY